MTTTDPTTIVYAAGVAIIPLLRCTCYSDTVEVALHTGMTPEGRTPKHWWSMRYRINEGKWFLCDAGFVAGLCIGLRHAGAVEAMVRDDLLNIRNGDTHGCGAGCFLNSLAITLAGHAAREAARQ